MDINIAFSIKGIIIGFSIAAPVGPIGVLCTRRVNISDEKKAKLTLCSCSN